MRFTKSDDYEGRSCCDETFHPGRPVMPAPPAHRDSGYLAIRLFRA